MGILKRGEDQKTDNGHVRSIYLSICSYNKTRKEFPDADAYNTYLEEREELSKLYVKK